MKWIGTLVWLVGLFVLAAWLTGCDAGPEPAERPSKVYTAFIQPDGVIHVPAGPPGTPCELDGTIGYAQNDGTTWFQFIIERPVDMWVVMTCDYQEPVLIHVVEPATGRA